MLKFQPLRLRDSQVLQENNTYVINRFRVCNAKDFYMPIEGPYMLELTCHTKINPTTSTATFPDYIYKLTPFQDLPPYIGDTKKFLGNALKHIFSLHYTNNYLYKFVIPHICLQMLLAFSSKSLNLNGYSFPTRRNLTFGETCS